MELSDLESYAEALKKKFALPGSASPEDQLKPHVSKLLSDAGTGYGLTVETRTETHLSEHGVRPDIAVYVGGLICGYVELKAPGLGADAPKLQGKHNREQWRKLQSLPNLIYTDGREWALYRSGECRDGQPIRLHGDPIAKGKAATKEPDAKALERLLRDFLGWEPIVPHKPTRLAEYLAPLTRFLRSEVETALAAKKSAVGGLAKEWRQYFFPNADNAQFADAYAQTVTYAMLLARLSGAAKLDPTGAASTLDKNNGLLAQTLKLLGQEEARKELSVGFNLLQRSLEALDPHDFEESKPDLWLYFYENFLAAYDSKLRKDHGVYYTPREVVELQVRLASELLDERFGKKLGFVDDNVMFLDPATGTGTYLVAAVKHGLERVRHRQGDAAVPEGAKQIARNMHGFEILVGPYAVAHLRLTQALEGAINEGKAEGEADESLGERLKIYLADTLESPNASPPGGLTLTHRALTQEHEAAREAKNEGNILVCLGNPPYDRQHIKVDDHATRRKGGWVRFGDQEKGAAKQEKQEEYAIFNDFIAPATKSGASVHVKNLYNDYVYFWRWALWRLFERQDRGGIVTFITASSYLAGPGFVGMREMMRRAFDELWIIDLGGDNIGARKTPNVFNIQTPVAIAMGVRGARPSPDAPAKVRYAKVEGARREDKLEQLEAVADINGFEWRDCPDDWHKPFLPAGKGDYFEWPALIDVFPWQHSGLQFKRLWPIGETAEVLRKRWDALVNASEAEREEYFRKSYHRTIHRAYSDFSGKPLKRISQLAPSEPMPEVSRYCYRSFDRQYALIDARLGDALRPPLVQANGEGNVFFASMLTKAIGVGPAMVSSSAIPDLDVFCGRGGKDVIPLYRDADAAEANVTAGLLDALGEEYGAAPTAEDLASYVYAVLGGRSYTRRFWSELEMPGLRIPITRDGATFAEAANLGRKLIWLHTYAERFRGDGRGNEVPKGVAATIKGVSYDPANYPDEYGYSESEREIRVGNGRFGPVEREVWDFEISGLKVVQSWLGYRMRKRKGKKSSPLDEMRPERWTPEMSSAFLELLWVLEATLKMEPKLEAALDEIVAGPCFSSGELPQPSEEERKPPALEREADYEQTVMSSIVNGQGGGEEE